MGSKQWIVVALLAAASAQAQDAASSSRDNQARIYIAPYAGYAHLRVDRGRIYEQDDTVGVVFYWVIPFVALAAGILFTKWYPERARARARTAADAAGSSA